MVFISSVSNLCSIHPVLLYLTFFHGHPLSSRTTVSLSLLTAPLFLRIILVSLATLISLSLSKTPPSTSVASTSSKQSLNHCLCLITSTELTMSYWVAVVQVDSPLTYMLTTSDRGCLPRYTLGPLQIGVTECILISLIASVDTVCVCVCVSSAPLILTAATRSYGPCVCMCSVLIHMCVVCMSACCVYLSMHSFPLSVFVFSSFSFPC